MKTIYHKKNELFEVEFFADKEYTDAFDFTNVNQVYIELNDGDCTPLLKLHALGSFNIFIPYIPQSLTNLCKYELVNTYVTTLNDITPNLSKYIPEDNAVLFLTEKNFFEYVKIFQGLDLIASWGKGMMGYKKITIFLPHGTQSEIQKAIEVEKELKEKYGVKEVNLFVLHCFVNIFTTVPSKSLRITNLDGNVILGKPFAEEILFNKIITTNSTSILPVQDGERLQVIDCKEIFEEHFK